MLKKGDNVAKIRKAVIPAAGLGTRFLPATKAVPKCCPSWTSLRFNTLWKRLFSQESSRF